MRQITANARENEGEQQTPRGQRKKARRGKRSRQRAYERWIVHRYKAAERRQERGRLSNIQKPEQTEGPAMYAESVHQASSATRPTAIIHPQSTSEKSENATQPAMQPRIPQVSPQHQAPPPGMGRGQRLLWLMQQRTQQGNTYAIGRGHATWRAGYEQQTVGATRQQLQQQNYANIIVQSNFTTTAVENLGQTGVSTRNVFWTQHWQTTENVGIREDEPMDQTGGDQGHESDDDVIFVGFE